MAIVPWRAVRRMKPRMRDVALTLTLTRRLGMCLGVSLRRLHVRKQVLLLLVQHLLDLMQLHLLVLHEGQEIHAHPTSNCGRRGGVVGIRRELGLRGDSRQRLC